MKLLRSFILPILFLGCSVQENWLGRSAAVADQPPYPPSPVIVGYSLDWTTHRREAPGSDNWPMTWSDDGHPIWTRDIEQKGPVFQDPLGVGWNVSVSYNAGLKRYLLCTEHNRTHLAHFGLFDAPQPWGPWTTVAYENAWGAGYVPQDTFYWSFPTKWMSSDGREFTLLFTGRSVNDSFNTVRGQFQLRGRSLEDH